VPRYGESAFHGRWVHAHEEDTDGELVFRPASHPLPPSRGRTWLELRPDGTFLQSSPGPVDVPQQSSGRWSLQADRLVLDPHENPAAHSYQVIATAADRLVLKRSAGHSR
jgi:hypothetical protein